MSIRRHGLRRIYPEQNRHCQQRDCGLHHETEGEQRGRPDIHGPLHKLRAKHASEDAASHDPRDRFGPERRAGAIGGGKPI